MNRKTLLILVVIASAIIGMLILNDSLALSYWDGGEFAGQPVVDSFGKISRDAHLEFRQCGLEDSDISALLVEARSYRGKYLRTDYDSEGKAIRHLSVAEITRGIFEVKCALN